MSVDVVPKFLISSISGYENQIREVFRETFLLGKPLDIAIDNFDLYEEMSLGWYLSFGSIDSAVVLDSVTQELVGYVLVCTNSTSYDRWLRTRVWRVFRRNLFHLVTGRLSRVSRQFYGRRFLDALTVQRSRTNHGAFECAHVHMNLRESARTGAIALALVTHVDQMCHRARISGWTGEVNGLAGSRIRAIGRVVGEIVDVKVNRTASFFCGQEVNRITVLRKVS